MSACQVGLVASVHRIRKRKVATYGIGLGLDKELSRPSFSRMEKADYDNLDQKSVLWVENTNSTALAPDGSEAEVDQEVARMADFL